MARGGTTSFVALVLAALLTAAGDASPQTARELYSAALGREQAVRMEKAATLKDYRAAVAAYDAVVRKNPASGYVDNALWQGASLALEAFERFGEERDQNTARRMLQLLANDYQFSPLSAKARDTLKRMEKKPAAPPTATTPAVPSRTPSKKLVSVKDVRRTAAAEHVRVTIELDGQAAYRTESVEGPRRMFVDIPDSKLGSTLREGTIPFEEELVRRVRVGRHPNDTTRVVVDLDGIKGYTVTTVSDPFRIVVDCEPATTRPIPPPPDVQVKVKTPPEPAPPPKLALPTTMARKAPAPAAPKPAATPVPKPLFSHRWLLAPALAPEVTGVDLASLREQAIAAPASRPKPSVGPEKPASPSPSPVETAASPNTSTDKPAPAVPPRGSYSLSRQLGLGASKIVIDPGHGGHDPGALGPGINEAEVVLDVALRLETLLREGGFDVVLTRRTDEFIPLEERPAIATREQGDLFLSIHANASRSRVARGIETYFLNFSNDPDAEAVAVRENAATERRMNNLPDIVKAITLNNKLDESRSFAGLVQHSLAQQLAADGAPVTDHGVKQAPFVVLIGAAMPSVLVEISFITNTQEGRLLKTPAYRQKIARALFEGIKGYQRSLKGVAPALYQ